MYLSGRRPQLGLNARIPFSSTHKSILDDSNKVLDHSKECNILGGLNSNIVQFVKNN